jgi:hypothetical protein
MGRKSSDDEGLMRVERTMPDFAGIVRVLTTAEEEAAKPKSKSQAPGGGRRRTLMMSVTIIDLKFPIAAALRRGMPSPVIRAAMPPRGLMCRNSAVPGMI